MPLLLRPSAPSPSIDELAFACRSRRSPRCAPCLDRLRPAALRHPRPTVLASPQQHGRHRERVQRLHGRNVHGPGAPPPAQPVAARQPAELAAQQRHPQAQGHNRAGRRLPRLEALAARDAARRRPPVQRRRQLPVGGRARVERAELRLLVRGRQRVRHHVLGRHRQLAVVDKELRDFRKTFVRKLYTRFTKISGLGRRKASVAKPVF